MRKTVPQHASFWITGCRRRQGF